jgi:hypothetical protein
MPGELMSAVTAKADISQRFSLTLGFQGYRGDDTFESV